MKTTRFWKNEVSIEVIYDKLLLYSDRDYSLCDDFGITKEERYWTQLDKSTRLSFCSPYQIVLMEDLQTGDKRMSGIEFEEAFELLEPYMRTKKIEKLLTKNLRNAIRL